MSDECRRLILERIRQHGPLTFEQFMELALYEPGVGYYASAMRRSGRSGDFYTSVDVSPIFGELLAEQFAEMTDILGRPLDLVEVGAGSGRLSRDVLEALETIAPAVYSSVRLHLVERSEAARGAQRETLGRHAAKLESSTADLPSSIHGVVFANELLDALPTHAVVAREDGLREIFVDARGDDLIEREMAPSTPALGEYLDRVDAHLLPGWRSEVNLRAIDWVRQAASAVGRGFLVLIDYGHEAPTLYSASHARGTLATFSRHVVEADEGDRQPPWLTDAGDRDITAHVDFTSVRAAAEAAGLTAICTVDQMHFLLGLDVESRLLRSTGTRREDIARRLALKTLLVPGGLGTTHHVMMFGKGVGRPQLKGCGARG